jgi:hypothetical protein
LDTETTADRRIVAALAVLTEANACLVKQFEDHSSDLKEIGALLTKERAGAVAHFLLALLCLVL